MVLGQIIVVVMVDKHIKFHKILFKTYKVIAKFKVCHNYASANDAADTRVMTIPQLVFL